MLISLGPSGSVPKKIAKSPFNKVENESGTTQADPEVTFQDGHELPELLPTWTKKGGGDININPG